MRTFVGLAVALVACGPTRSDAPWRACEVASVEARPPVVPSARDLIVPVVVDAEMPTFRISPLQDDAESLANRVLSAACVMTGGEVEATEAVLAWAEGAVNEDARFLGDPGFDPPIWVEREAYGVPKLRMQVPRDRLPPRDVVPTVDERGAEAIARQAVADLREVGFLADVDHALTWGRSRGSRECTMAGCEERVVERYLFGFSPRYVGVPVSGTYIQVDVSVTGELVELNAVTLDVVDAGTVIAAVTEAEADSRFDALIRAEYPTAEVGYERPGLVAYIGPTDGDSGTVEAEPVWSAVTIAKLESGILDRPRHYTLSLTDPEAPIVLREW